MQHPHIKDQRIAQTAPHLHLARAGLEETTAAPLLEAPHRKNGIDTGAVSSPTTATKAEDVPSVTEQPAPQSVPEREPLKVPACSWSGHVPPCAIFLRCGRKFQWTNCACHRKMKAYALTPCLQPVQAKEVSAPHVVPSAPRAPAAEVPKQADAELSVKTAAPAPSAEVAAEAASAEPVTAQPTPAEALEARLEPAEADAAQPGPAEASGAQPALDAPVMPETAPPPRSVTAEAAPNLEGIPIGLLESDAKKKIDPAKSSSGSAPPIESQGEPFKAIHCKPLWGTSSHAYRPSALPHRGSLFILARSVKVALHRRQ